MLVPWIKVEKNALKLRYRPISKSKMLKDKEVLAVAEATYTEIISIFFCTLTIMNYFVHYLWTFHS